MGNVYSRKEVSAHCTEQDCWLIIHNQVYDVTSFLEEHPGGKEVLLALAGSDATNAFEDVGHNIIARAMLKSKKIGELRQEDHEIWENQYVHRDSDLTFYLVTCGAVLLSTIFVLKVLRRTV